MRFYRKVIYNKRTHISKYFFKRNANDRSWIRHILKSKCILKVAVDLNLYVWLCENQLLGTELSRYEWYSDQDNNRAILIRVLNHILFYLYNLSDNLKSNACFLVLVCPASPEKNLLFSSFFIFCFIRNSVIFSSRFRWEGFHLLSFIHMSWCGTAHFHVLGNKYFAMLHFNKVVYIHGIWVSIILCIPLY